MTHDEKAILRKFAILFGVKALLYYGIYKTAKTLRDAGLPDVPLRSPIGYVKGTDRIGGHAKVDFP